MSSRPQEWKFRIRHMIAAITRVLSYTDGISYQDFVNDPRTKAAVERDLEILGQAARLVPPEVTVRFPQIPWSKMRGMRNVLAHEYDSINYDSIWSTIQLDLPALLPLLQSLLEQEGDV